MSKILRVTKMGRESEWTLEKGKCVLEGTIVEMTEYDHPYHHVIALLDTGRAIKISTPDVIIYGEGAEDDLKQARWYDTINRINL